MQKRRFCIAKRMVTNFLKTGIASAIVVKGVAAADLGNT
jgi:hypothetical protein